MLRFNRFCAAAVANLLLFIFDLGQQVDDASRVLFEVRRFAIDGRVQSGRRHAASSRRGIAEIKYTVSKTFLRAARIDCSTVKWEGRFFDELSRQWVWSICPGRRYPRCRICSAHQ